MKQTTSKKSEKIKDLQNNLVDGLNKPMTTDLGVGINDDHNSLKSFERGSSLLEDFILRDKLQHFDRERIPERVVHARGTGAHGVFKLSESLEKYTKAKFLNTINKETPVFVRFSTVAGFRGSTDLARDVRGFSVKFYTEEGNYDLVGNNIPVFFIQDAMKFPDLVHAVKPEPDNEMPQAASAHDTFWDFISLMPESAHMLMWVMSDRAIPRSYRMMEGFGVHTFKLINAKNEVFFVKFHWKPILGVHSVTWDEAQKISGKDSDFHRKDLYEAIENGDYPEWELGVQIVPEKDEHKFDFDLLDPTKLIPEELVPVKIVGKMTLNKNTDNFFAETEQAAFHPGNLVPGIDFSNDPLLQGRLFSYSDTQLYRLGGPNFNQLPINRAINEVHNSRRDGVMQTAIHTGKATYSPNTLGGGCPFMAKASQGGFTSHAEKTEGNKTRSRSALFFDHFSQAKLFFNSQSKVEQQHIQDAIAFELSKLQHSYIREKMVQNLTNISLEMAQYIASKLGIKAPKKVYTWENKALPADANPTDYASLIKESSLEKAPSLSMENKQGEALKTRKVAVLLADGFDSKSYKALDKKSKSNGVQLCGVAPKLGVIKSDSDFSITVAFTFFNCASVLFDAVYVMGGKACLKNLINEPESIHFVNETYKHCKAIGGGIDTTNFFNKTYIQNLSSKNGVVVNGEVAEFFDAVAKQRYWERENEKGVPA